jgi:hypothetical protein
VTTLELKIGATSESNRQYRYPLYRLHGEEPTEQPPLYANETGIVRMEVCGGDSFHAGSGFSVEFKEVLNITNPMTGTEGVIYKWLHRSEIGELRDTCSYSTDERVLLNLITKNAIKEEYKEWIAHNLLFICLVHDPKLREPIATRFPWFWNTFKERIKQDEFRRAFEETIWTLLDACPQHFKGEKATVKDAEEGNFWDEGRMFETQARFLRERLEHLYKYAPPMYRRIMDTAVTAIEKEASEIQRVQVAAEMLKEVRKGKTG